MFACVYRNDVGGGGEKETRLETHLPELAGVLVCVLI